VNVDVPNREKYIPECSAGIEIYVGRVSGFVPRMGKNKPVDTQICQA
jgi:hypothetical protein